MLPNKSFRVGIPSQKMQDTKLIFKQINLPNHQ